MQLCHQHNNTLAWKQKALRVFLKIAHSIVSWKKVLWSDETRMLKKPANSLDV